MVENELKSKTNIRTKTMWRRHKTSIVCVVLATLMLTNLVPVTLASLDPVAYFSKSAETVLTGEAISFDASASWDPDGYLVSWNWDFGDGNVDTGVVVAHSWSTGGTFTVTLTVTDNDGDTGSISSTITVLSASPVAYFSKSAETVLTGEAISFDASASWDPDGYLVSWNWDFGDGNVDTGVVVAHSWSTGGTFTVTLTVTDNDGDTGSISSTITVLSASPVAYFSKSAETVLTGEAISFDASASWDPDGYLVSWNWDFGDGNVDTGVVVAHSWSTGGTFTVTLTVTDNDGDTGSISSTITVLSASPVAYFSKSAETVLTGEAISFDASASWDPDGYLVSWNWDFGDGNVDTGVVVAHSWSISGLFGVTLTVTDNDGNTDSESKTITVEGKSATYMVYLDADNNLEEFGINSFLEMASVGSTPNVNIVVQMDRIDGYNASYGDWTECRRFYITEGMTPTVTNSIEDLGEVNMGDPNVLVNFVQWATGNYRAEKYILVLWDHGTGWLKGVCRDDSENPYDWVDLAELRQALISIRDFLGRNIDILGFDACLMQMIEVAYQVRDTTDIVVGSADIALGNGWPHDDILSYLVESPFVGSQDLASYIVNAFADSFQNGGPGSSWVTQSAFYVSQLTDNVAQASSIFADRLIENIQTSISEIESAFGQTEKFDSVGDYAEYRDLYDFAHEIQQEVDISNVQTAAQDVMDTILESRIEERHGSSHIDSYGLGIYLPNQGSYDSSYETLDFAVDKSWDEFLQQLENARSVQYQLTISVSTPESGSTNPSSGVHIYYGNEDVIVTADPNPGYCFSKWNLDGVDDLSDSITLEMDYMDHELVCYMQLVDIAVIDVGTSKTVIGQNFTVPVSVEVENQGNHSETFDVALYTTVWVGSVPIFTAIDVITVVDLNPGESTILEFTWDTTGWDKGNWTLSAYAFIFDESDESDNLMYGDLVLVSLPGDVDEDRDVDIFDIVAIAGSYGISEGQPGYVPNCDIDSSGVIDIFDVVIAQTYYWQSW